MSQTSFPNFAVVSEHPRPPDDVALGSTWQESFFSGNI